MPWLRKCDDYELDLVLLVFLTYLQQASLDHTNIELYCKLYNHMLYIYIYIYLCIYLNIFIICFDLLTICIHEIIIFDMNVHTLFNIPFVDFSVFYCVFLIFIEKS